MLGYRLVVVLLCFLVPLTVHSQTTAIRAGRVVDPDTGAVSTNQIILVEKGKISAIGAGVSIPANANVIDLSRATVLPGLFDAHTHLCMSVNPKRDAESYYYTTLNDPNSFRAIQGVANGLAMLQRSEKCEVRDEGWSGD